MTGHREYKIVLLPGLDGTGRLFLPLLSCVDDPSSLLVVRYQDLPADLDQLTEQAEAMIPEGQAVILIAESFSSLVALRLLERGKLQIAGILFFAGFARAPCPLLLNLARFVPATLIKIFSTNPLLVRLFFLTNKMPLSVFDLYLDVVRGLPSEVLKDRIRLLHGAKNLPSIRTDIPFGQLRIRGDLLVSKRSTTDLRTLNPALFIWEVDGTHFFLQTNPEKSLQIIREFCQSATGSTPV